MNDLGPWIISETQAGERLDVFLRGLFPDLSRSSLQKEIKNGRITVNGEPAMVHRFLKVGDRVQMMEEKTTKLTADRLPEDDATAEQSPEMTALNIVAETADWMVIDKPAGLLVHPDAKNEHGTLIDLLIKHDPKIAKIGPEPERPGIVHRLDREVSGLMVVAKTPRAYDSLHDQFAQRRVKKTYLALVHGVVSHDEDDIKLSIERSATKARMAARPRTTKNGVTPEESGKAAWTHYRVVERFVGATLLEIQILSGRTHQIRAHLHAIGHPVMGDSMYVIKRTDRNETAPRLMLESVDLSFDDPANGERQSFHLEPDPAFAKMIEEFRRS